MRPTVKLLLLLFTFTLAAGMPELRAQVKQQTAEERAEELQRRGKLARGQIPRLRTP